MNTKITTALLAVGIIVLSGFIYYSLAASSPDVDEDVKASFTYANPDDKPAEEKPLVKPTPEPPIKENGLKIGELRDFGIVSIRPLSVEEDSRCPIDVTCIQAGTVRLKIEITQDNGNKSIEIVKLGEKFLTKGVQITLIDVSPVPNSKITISPTDYRFVFDVKKAADVVVTPPAKCYVGGCSGEICSDTDGMVSNCMYREEFACYQTAKCERQPSGTCGWTPTAELNSCIQNAR